MQHVVCWRSKIRFIPMKLNIVMIIMTVVLCCVVKGFTSRSPFLLITTHLFLSNEFIV